jgi:hypothetical protein
MTTGLTNGGVMRPSLRLFASWIRHIIWSSGAAPQVSLGVKTAEVRPGMPMEQG